MAWATGEYDLIMEAVFSSDEQLPPFLTGQLAAIPGIRSVATAHVLRTAKPLADWRLPSMPPPTVLIVDDDPDFVAITQSVLESAGYRVASAASGNEALAVMRRQHPALVILDVMMEVLLDGLYAIRAIRLDQNLQRIPIIMVSSITQSPMTPPVREPETVTAPLVEVWLSEKVNE